MRSKEEILKETIKIKSHTPDWDTTASTHERLTIEVLIDIRDILERPLISLDNTLLKHLFSTQNPRKP